jgi:hypothetical protein
MDYETHVTHVLYWKTECIRCKENKYCVQADNILGSLKNFCLSCIQESIFEQLTEAN